MTTRGKKRKKGEEVVTLQSISDADLDALQYKMGLERSIDFLVDGPGLLTEDRMEKRIQKRIELTLMEERIEQAKEEEEKAKKSKMSSTSLPPDVEARLRAVEAQVGDVKLKKMKTNDVLEALVDKKVQAALGKGHSFANLSQQAEAKIYANMAKRIQTLIDKKVEDVMSSGGGDGGGKTIGDDDADDDKKMLARDDKDNGGTKVSENQDDAIMDVKIQAAVDEKFAEKFDASIANRIQLLIHQQMDSHIAKAAEAAIDRKLEAGMVDQIAEAVQTKMDQRVNQTIPRRKSINGDYSTSNNERRKKGERYSASAAIGSPAGTTSIRSAVTLASVIGSHALPPVPPPVSVKALEAQMVQRFQAMEAAVESRFEEEKAQMIARMAETIEAKVKEELERKIEAAQQAFQAEQQQESRVPQQQVSRTDDAANASQERGMSTASPSAKSVEHLERKMMKEFLSVERAFNAKYKSLHDEHNALVVEQDGMKQKIETGKPHNLQGKFDTKLRHLRQEFEQKLTAQEEELRQTFQKQLAQAAPVEDFDAKVKAVEENHGVRLGTLEANTMSVRDMVKDVFRNFEKNAKDVRADLESLGEKIDGVKEDFGENLKILQDAIVAQKEELSKKIAQVDKSASKMHSTLQADMSKQVGSLQKSMDNVDTMYEDVKADLDQLETGLGDRVSALEDAWRSRNLDKKAALEQVSELTSKLEKSMARIKRLETQVATYAHVNTASIPSTVSTERQESSVAVDHVQENDPTTTSPATLSLGTTTTKRPVVTTASPATLSFPRTTVTPSIRGTGASSSAAAALGNDGSAPTSNTPSTVPTTRNAAANGQNPTNANDQSPTIPYTARNDAAAMPTASEVERQSTRPRRTSRASTATNVIPTNVSFVHGLDLSPTKDFPPNLWQLVSNKSVSEVSWTSIGTHHAFQVSDTEAFAANILRWCKTPFRHDQIPNAGRWNRFKDFLEMFGFKKFNKVADRDVWYHPSGFFVKNNFYLSKSIEVKLPDSL